MTSSDPRDIPPSDAESIPVARDDVRLAILRAAPALRPALHALFALDARLGTIVRTTRDPMVGQMRLTWWHEALVALDDAGAPAEPVLRALRETVVARGIGGRDLAAMIDGWEMLLDDIALDEATLLDFAQRRGGRLFVLAARLSRTREPVEEMGTGWALADLALRWSDPDTAASAAALARDRLTEPRWGFARGPLATMALLASADLRRAASPGRRSPFAWIFDRR